MTGRTTGRPRPRGDGPAVRWWESRRPESPPPTRGWTHHGRVQGARPDVAPAHAGMDPFVRCAVTEPLSRPRPRGDGPCPTSSSARAKSSPPPTRGWTPVRGPCSFSAPVAPAHAGMDRCRADGVASWRGRPRPRGDGPYYDVDEWPRGRSPPPTRGWTWRAIFPDGSVIVAPAHAGMDPLHDRLTHRLSRRPRPRGDGPPFEVADAVANPSPPPTRGWTRTASAAGAGRGVAPAHAGMDLIAAIRTPPPCRRPRPRGDGPSSFSVTAATPGSPPPTRGWTHVVRHAHFKQFVAPAHAGMDPLRSGAWPLPRSRPRPRGDGPSAAVLAAVAPRSPPPTRGWTAWRDHRRRCAHVAPAHAGMDPRRLPPPTPTTCRPRPRGDGPGLGGCLPE